MEVHSDLSRPGASNDKIYANVFHTYAGFHFSRVGQEHRTLVPFNPMLQCHIGNNHSKELHLKLLYFYLDLHAVVK